MKDTQLYIANKLADLDGESIITMTYAHEDSDNPTIVKNNFSKSISLPATSNNNDIFGHIYDLKRVTDLVDGKTSGVNFNALKRTPFQLFVNGDLAESGYIQLTNIVNNNGNVRYTIQAYGGLGDFLYNLMYDEENEKRSLADLQYGITGYSGEPANEMDFNICKEVVKEAWNNMPRGGNNRLFDVINFVPAYNGVPKDFESKKVLFNYDAAMGIPRTFDDIHTTYNGYGMLELDEAVDEAETRDLRSYLQRPCLSVRALFEACCRPENNGGYSVELDKTFFNEENALYNDAYITLPMLQNEMVEKEITKSLPGATSVLGGRGNTFVIDRNFGVIKLSDTPVNGNIKVKVSFSFNAEYVGEELYTSIDEYGLELFTPGNGKPYYREILRRSYNSAFVAQLIVRDLDMNTIAASQEIAFSNKGNFSQNWEVYTAGESKGVTNIVGCFRKNGGIKLDFETAEHNNVFTLDTTFTRGSNSSVLVFLRLQRAYEKADAGISDNAGLLWRNDRYTLDSQTSKEDYMVKGFNVYAPNEGSVEIATTNLPSISSNSKVTKALLLGSTESPADYLLSYTKLFGLHFIKDKTEKTITITPNFYNSNIIDIDNRIGHAEITITPYVFSKKFLRMGLKQPETYFSKKYREANKLEYGQKRIDTGIAFNNDTEEIYKGNVYTSAVPCLATSPYFSTFYSSNRVEIYPMMAGNPKITYVKGANGARSTTELASANYIDVTKTVPFNVNRGYDLMPRMCYYNVKNSIREAADISNNLVVFSRNVELTNSQGTAMPYWLTDDVPEMLVFAEANCPLLTNRAINARGDTIAIKCDKLPLLLNMRMGRANNVLDTLDFAKSKEAYRPGLQYPDGLDIYSRFWDKHFTDRMHVDTCKVVCDVDLAGMPINADMLRNIFFFEGNYWVLNKIEDYDPVEEKLTKCEFIKVRDLGAYFTSENGK